MLRRSDLQLIGAVFAALIILGLALGYAAGGAMKPAPIVTQSGERPPPAFAEGTAGGLPAYGNVYVNDYADLLGQSVEAGIRADLIELYDHTGVEMTVLTIPSRAAYGFRGSNEEFATALFNAWGIGNADSNDGVLILVSPGDREMRIELGAGYGGEWDARMQTVVDRSFLPHFREDRYEAGIDAGVDESIRAITGVYPGHYTSGAVMRGWSGIGHFLSGLAVWWLGLLALPLGGAVIGLRAYARRRPRDCATCGAAMIRQGEDLDDAHLDGGQRLEEYVRSVDYDVWECPSCNRMEISRHPSWFSGHGTCPACKYRTLASETDVLEQATTSSTGRKRIDYSCANCGHAFSETRTIPKKSKSSSGSGRSSFGGGSSSGGGASGRW